MGCMAVWLPLGLGWERWRARVEGEERGPEKEVGLAYSQWPRHSQSHPGTSANMMHLMSRMCPAQYALGICNATAGWDTMR